MERYLNNKVKSVFLIFLLPVLLFSCRSVKQVTEQRDVPNISEARLFKNIYAAELDYSSLYARRLDVSYTSNGKSSGFRASMKIKRDSFIYLSVSAPLGIEVARILLTRDSVKFADMFHKKYFISDYRYFFNRYDINISFDCLQKILTNTFFDFESCGNGKDLKEKRYKFEKTEDAYQLSTIEEKILDRRLKKLYKKKKKNKEFVLILQKVMIDSKFFRPLSMSMEDMDEKIGIKVNYNDFQNFGDKLFPAKIRFSLFSENGSTDLEIGFSRLEFDVPVEANFRISSKYKQIQQLE